MRQRWRLAHTSGSVGHAENGCRTSGTGYPANPEQIVPGGKLSDPVCGSSLERDSGASRVSTVWRARSSEFPDGSDGLL